MTDALALHERMTALKMRLLGDRVSRRAAWNLAREHGWDDLRYAEYLAVTQLQADALVAGVTTNQKRWSTKRPSARQAQSGALPDIRRQQKLDQ